MRALGRLANLLEVLALSLLLAAALGLLEGLFAASQIGESVVRRVTGAVAIDLMLLAPLGLGLGLAAALMPRPRPIDRWTQAAAVVPPLALLAVVLVVSVGRREAGGVPAFRWLDLQPLPPVASDPDAPALVLVTLDTLRPDALEHMPLLSARARTARVWTRAHTPAPWTLPAMASLHTGTPVSVHGAGARVDLLRNHLRTPPEADLELLAQALARRGFVNAAVVTNPYLSDRYGFDRGFDRFRELSSRAQMVSGLRRSWLLRWVLPPMPDSPEAVTAEALELLEQGERGRLFLWVHHIEAHAPYTVLDGRDTRDACELPDCFQDWSGVRKGETTLTEAERQRVRELYRADLARLDRSLEVLLQGVDQRLGPRALVVLTADHGEELWDHGGVEHGHAFHEEITRVPMLAWGGGLEAGEVDRAVDLVGLHDALLAWVDGRGLGPLEASGPDALTPMQSMLFGEERSACTDGHLRVEHDGTGQTVTVELTPGAATADRLARVSACVPGAQALREDELVEDLGVLRSLGYVD